MSHESRMPPTRPLGPPPRRPDLIALVWIGGVALAAVAYSVGPDHLIASTIDAIDRAGWVVTDLVRNLTAQAFEAMRAAAIGLLGVFVALSLIGIQRSNHGRGGLIAVTIGFLMLVWGAEGDGPGAHTRWLLALALAGLGAVAATNRLVHPPAPGGWRVERPGE